MCLKKSQPCAAMGIGEKDPWWPSRSSKKYPFSNILQYCNSVWALPEKSNEDVNTNINIMASSKQSLQKKEKVSPIDTFQKQKDVCSTPYCLQDSFHQTLINKRKIRWHFWVISSPMLSVAMMIYSGLGHELHWWDCVRLPSIKLYKSLLMSLVHNSLENNRATRAYFLCYNIL